MVTENHPYVSALVCMPGEKRAQHWMGQMLWESGGQKREALRFLNLAAQQGHVASLKVLSRLASNLACDDVKQGHILRV